MITDKGKNVLAKYIIGQAPSYASFIALGVGPKPLATADPVGDYATNTALDFEVLRIPISSRGYTYDEQGKANVVFSGELPTEQRYEFTEIGIFSGKSNPAAGSRGSRVLYTFSDSENWEFHDQTSASSVPLITEPLFQNVTNPGENRIDARNPETNELYFAFRGSSTNSLFAGSDVRLNRYETPRFLDKALFLKGDMSKLEAGTDSSGNPILSLTPNTPDYYSSHIHLLGPSANLNDNASGDQLKLAFSIVNTLDTETTQIDNVKIMIEFASSDALTSDSRYARFNIDMSSADFDFVNNRYYVATTSLADLYIPDDNSADSDDDFRWDLVRAVKVYASVYEKVTSGDPILSDKFYVALDGLRFENTSSISPLYGMTGYSVVRNDSESTIVKESNSSNLVEFRFGLDVQ